MIKKIVDKTHKFYVLNIAFKEHEKQLFRVITFNAQLDIDELAFTILSIFNTAASHLYSFTDVENTYHCQIGIENSYTPDEDIPTEGVTIDKLILKDNQFEMLYDFGDDNRFVITILEVIQKEKFTTVPEVIDGLGYGIAEDNHYELDKYLNGEQLEEPLLFYYNGRFNVEHDFNDFNIEECNKILKRRLSKIRAAYLYY